VSYSNYTSLIRFGSRFFSHILRSLICARARARVCVCVYVCMCVCVCVCNVSDFLIYNYFNYNL